MDAKLWITAHQEMHVIGHHFHLDKHLPPLLNDLGNQGLESRVDPINQDAAPVLGAKHDVVMAMVYNILVALNYCLYVQIMA